MLVKILKSDIAKVWSIVAPMLEISMPDWAGYEVTDSNMVNMLEAMLDGSLTTWFLYEDKEDPKLLGMITTYFTYDVNGGNKSLSIYNLMSLENIPRSMWFKGFRTIAKYAKSKNCKKVVIVSEYDKIINLCKRLGAKTTTTLIEWDLK